MRSIPPFVASQPFLRRSTLFSLATVAFAVLLPMARQASMAQSPAQSPVKTHAAAQSEGYGRLPLSFERNQGQADPGVRFTSRGLGYSLFLTDSEAVLALHPGEAAKTRSASSHPGASGQTEVLRMQLAGSRSASPNATVSGLDQLPGTANYFFGSDPSQWHTAVPTYAKVRYASVYPGIDLVYYGNQRQLEYDFIVAPNADPKAIRLSFTGAKRLSLTSQGDLRVIAHNGEVAFQKPVLYQLDGDRRQPVAGSFQLASDNTVAFHVGRYNHARPLIIDPTLTYSTYLGGSNIDVAAGIAVDKSGNAYVTGSSLSPDFPVTKGAYDTVNNTINGNGDAATFITKLNPAGTALIYSTYLGGNGGGYATSIAIDSAGNAYVAGVTDATDFPVTAGAFQSTLKANATPGSNAFLTKLNPTGTALVYSTYLGGSTYDQANGIAVDASDNAYVVGLTTSTDFPVTAGAFQSKNNGATNSTGNGFVTTNAFVSKMNPTGTALVYSTYLGGNGNDNFPAVGDSGAAIAVDASGNAYVTGLAASSDFPVTKGAYQVTNSDGSYGQNVFVTKLNPTGTGLVFSTYIGGTGGDEGTGIAQDTSGVYVTGQTFSDDFPVTAGVVQPVNNAAGNLDANAFVTKLNPAGTALIYSTYLGGSSPNGIGDFANAIAVDAYGDAYVTGETISEDFPVTKNAFQAVNNDADNLGTNAFISKLNPTGTALLYSSYLGGDGDRGGNGMNDIGFGIALDPSGNAYIAGQAYSTDFPVSSNAFQKVNKSAIPNAGYYPTSFIASFAIGSSTPTTTPTTTTLVSSANPQAVGESVTFTATVKPSTGTGTPTGSVAITLDGNAGPTEALSGGKAAFSTSALAAGQHTLVASYSGDSSFAASVSASLVETITEPVALAPVFSPAAGTFTAAQSVTLSDKTPGAVIYYTINGSTPTSASTKYTAAIPVASTTTIKAIAIAANYANSPVASATYTIETAAATPTFTPAAGTYTSAQSVKIASATPQSTVYFTTNGSTPTTSSTKYTAPIAVTATETIKAIAVATGFKNSAVASALYTIDLPAVATPVFTPKAGTYTSAQSVTITDATKGAVIYYTTNGVTPTTSSTKYTAAITVKATETLKAIAVATGFKNSAVASALYTIDLPAAATPVFTPKAGTYTSAQSVTITDTTKGAVIYYTTNGATPTTASTKYTAAITVKATETLKAIAVATGFKNSAVASALYTIDLPAAATPVFTPQAGTYTSIQSVTITDATKGAVIYYTTNGTAPTTSSTKYTAAVSVKATETLKAIAVASGFKTSAVASALYTIHLPATATPTFSVAAGTYAAKQTVKLADATTGAVIYYTTNGSAPTTSSTKYTSAITVSTTETIKAIAVASGHTTSAVASAAYTIQ
jgi:hypothetical protein